MTLTLINNVAELATEVPYRARLSAILKEEITRLWENSPYYQENQLIEAKVKRGIPLSDIERKQFIESERWSIEVLRLQLPDLIHRLSQDSPNLLKDLVGKHQLEEIGRGKKIEKLLLFIDDKERFYVDLFVFGPQAETPKHSHNAYCASFQFRGNLRENVFQPQDGNHQRIDINYKLRGEATVVSPYEDGDNDVHAIVNDSKTDFAATIHVYSQRVIGEDNVIKINRSEASTGPTAVKKYFVEKKDEPSFPLSTFVSSRFITSPRGSWAASVN